MSGAPQQLTEAITRMSDQELVRMLTRDSSQYREEALEIARRELQTRSVTLPIETPGDRELPTERTASDKTQADPTAFVGNAGRPRVVAMIIDNVLAYLLVLLSMGLCEIGAGARFVDKVGDIAAPGVYLAYFLLQEALWSRTLGKYVCGLIVRRVGGNRVGWREAAIRTLLRLLEVNPIVTPLPGGIAVLLSKRKQRIGDMLAGTVVVSTGQRAWFPIISSVNESDPR